MGGTEYSFNVHPSVIIYYSVPGVINTGDLFGMGEAMGATASPRIGIPASRSSPLPLGILPAAAAAAPTLSPKTQADDSPLLRSLSPILILPLGQASPAKFPEISLSNVHVPLEAIKPSESQEVLSLPSGVSGYCSLVNTDGSVQWLEVQILSVFFLSLSFCDV